MSQDLNEKGTFCTTLKVQVIRTVIERVKLKNGWLVNLSGLPEFYLHDPEHKWKTITSCDSEGRPL